MSNAVVSEDLLFCKALKLHAKGEDTFQCLNDFFKENTSFFRRNVLEFALMMQQHALASSLEL